MICDHDRKCHVSSKLVKLPSPLHEIILSAKVCNYAHTTNQEVTDCASSQNHVPKTSWLSGCPLLLWVSTTCKHVGGVRVMSQHLFLHGTRFLEIKKIGQHSKKFPVPFVKEPMTMKGKILPWYVIMTENVMSPQNLSNCSTCLQPHFKSGSTRDPN